MKCQTQKMVCDDDTSSEEGEVEGSGMPPLGRGMPTLSTFLLTALIASRESLGSQLTLSSVGYCLDLTLTPEANCCLDFLTNNVINLTIQWGLKWSRAEGHSQCH